MHKRIAQLLFITLICNNASGNTQEQHARTKTIGQHLRSAALTAYRWRGTLLTCISAGLAYHIYSQRNNHLAIDLSEIIPITLAPSPHTATPAHTPIPQNAQGQLLIDALLKSAPACPFGDCKTKELHLHSSNSTAVFGEQPQVISGKQYCFSPRQDGGRAIRYPTLVLVRPRSPSQSA